MTWEIVPVDPEFTTLAHAGFNTHVDTSKEIKAARV
jgi:hypothetical protein